MQQIFTVKTEGTQNDSFSWELAINDYSKNFFMFRVLVSPGYSVPGSLKILLLGPSPFLQIMKHPQRPFVCIHW